MNTSKREKSKKTNYVEMIVIDESEKQIAYKIKNYSHYKETIKNVGKALEIVFDALEDLEYNKYINESKRVIIYSNDKSVEKIFAGNYYSVKYREFEFIKYQLLIHENWKIVYDYLSDKNISYYRKKEKITYNKHIKNTKGKQSYRKKLSKEKIKEDKKTEATIIDFINKG